MRDRGRREHGCCTNRLLAAALLAALGADCGRPEPLEIVRARNEQGLLEGQISELHKAIARADAGRLATSRHRIAIGLGEDEARQALAAALPRQARLQDRLDVRFEQARPVFRGDTASVVFEATAHDLRSGTSARLEVGGRLVDVKVQHGHLAARVELRGVPGARHDGRPRHREPHPAPGAGQPRCRGRADSSPRSPGPARRGDRGRLHGGRRRAHPSGAAARSRPRSRRCFPSAGGCGSSSTSAPAPGRSERRCPGEPALGRDPRDRGAGSRAGGGRSLRSARLAKPPPPRAAVPGAARRPALRARRAREAPRRAARGGR